MLKFEGDRKPEIDHIVKKKDLENKKLTGLTQIIRFENIQSRLKS